MNTSSLLASAAFLLIGSAFVACAPGQPDGPTDEEIAEDEEALRQFCGGIAGFGCPDGKTCVDDPRDSCDPAQGGADCGGVCRPAKSPTKGKCKDPNRTYLGNSTDECAVIRFYCTEGTPFFDDCGCGCEVAPDGGGACAPDACGPALGMANYLCDDGVSVAGPTGNCLSDGHNGCGWEVLSCP